MADITRCTPHTCSNCGGDNAHAAMTFQHDQTTVYLCEQCAVENLPTFIANSLRIPYQFNFHITTATGERTPSVRSTSGIAKEVGADVMRQFYVGVERRRQEQLYKPLFDST